MEKKINDYLNNSTKLSKKDLFTSLKQGADLIRTGLDYRSLLIFLFYKAISDRYESKVNRIIKEKNLSREDAYIIANSEFKMYDENTKELITWKEITKKSNYLEDFQNALIKFAELNHDIISKDLMKALLDKLGISHLEREHMARLDQIKRIFDNLDFSNVDYDIIGDAYMYILAQFAQTKGKEGEVYTPYEVIKLLIKLIDPEPWSDILDPAMGSGAMLIEAYKYTKEKGKASLFGQEYNPDMAAIAKLNFILHGIEKNLVKIQVGDSLKKLKFDENSEFKVDYVVANPPWNQDGYGEETLGNDISLRKIYKYGFSPNNTADWAWVQLMLYYAKKKVGVILDEGALSREGKEKAIREKIVNDDLIEAIILLPKKLFYNTQGASGIIIIFNKEKQENRKRKIIFIDATDLYVKHPEVRKLNKLNDEHIQKIVETYREFKTIPGFSRVVDIEEIIKSNYDLRVYPYVTKIQDIDSISIEEIEGLWKNIEKIKKEREEKEKELEKIIKIIFNKNE